MFVGGWCKERIKLFFPALRLGKAAGGAESGFTGVEDFLLRPARRAYEEVKAHCLSAAVKHFCNVFPNRGAFQKMLVFFRNKLPVVGEDVL